MTATTVIALGLLLLIAAAVTTITGPGFLAFFGCLSFAMALKTA